MAKRTPGKRVPLRGSGFKSQSRRLTLGSKPETEFNQGLERGHPPDTSQLDPPSGKLSNLCYSPKQARAVLSSLGMLDRFHQGQDVGFFILAKLGRIATDANDEIVVRFDGLGDM